MPEGPEVTIVTKQLNNAVQNKTKLFPKNLFSNDENLINPNKWKKK